MRRATFLVSILAVVLLGMLAVGRTHRAATQDAAPRAGSRLADLGLPELRVRATAAGLEAPAETRAGRLLFTVENARATSPAGVLLVRLPAGLTEEQAEAAMAAAARTSQVPGWVHDWTFAGGLSVSPGETGRLVVELEPGDWYVADGGGTGARATPGPADQLRPLRVSGAARPAADEAPAADAAVELFELGFGGLPDGAAPGRQVWRVTNIGEQVHQIVLLRAPVPVTPDQVMTLLSLSLAGTPPPDFGFDPGLLEEADGVHLLSPGRTVWAEVDLAKPGTYVALCYMPDRVTGMPHAFLGMVGTFTVVASAGTSAP